MASPIPGTKEFAEAKDKTGPATWLSDPFKGKKREQLKKKKKTGARTGTQEREREREREEERIHSLLFLYLICFTSLTAVSFAVSFCPR